VLALDRGLPGSIRRRLNLQIKITSAIAAIQVINVLNYTT